MKDHILAALREEFEQWLDLLGSLSEEQWSTHMSAGQWSIKDVLAHLYVWQQRTLARSEAARLDLLPELPEWEVLGDPDAEGMADQVNAWIYSIYHNQSWSWIYQLWRDNFQKGLESASAIHERDLLDGGRYAWLNGTSMAMVLVASYDHHQEHLEKITAWLDKTDLPG